MIKGKDVVIHSDVEFKCEDVIIHDHCAIDKGVYCTTRFNLGPYSHISPYVTIIGGKDSAFISNGFNNIMAGARIVCCSDRFDDSGLFGAMIPKDKKGKQMAGGVLMEEFSNIGTNAIILPGTILRKGVLVTAGSLLIGDTVEWGVYKGNPAQLVKVLNGNKIINAAKELGYEG